MLDEDGSRLEHVLSELLVPDGARISAAEAWLSTYVQQSNSIVSFVNMVIKSERPDIRQLAATLLRKNLIKLWGKLADVHKEQLKRTLLQVLPSEQDVRVRNSIGDVISVIGLVEVPAGRWNELIQFLGDSITSSQDHTHRLQAVELFHHLLDSMGPCLKTMFNEMVGFFPHLLSDADPHIRAGALRNCHALLELADTKANEAKYLEVVPLIVQSTLQFVQKNDESAATIGLEIIDELLVNHFSGLGRYVEQLSDFAISVIQSEQTSIVIRLKACDFFTILCQRKPKFVSSRLSQILGAIFPLICIPAQELDDSKNPPYVLAARIIDVLGTHLPTEPVYQVIRALVSHYIASAVSFERRACMLSLTVLAEGSSQSFRNYLHELMPFIVTGMADSESIVRVSSLIALGQFARYCQPEILTPEYAGEILPRIVRVFQNPTVVHEEMEVACYALEEFVENLEEEIIAPYSQGLAELLLALCSDAALETAPDQWHQQAILGVQEIAVSALASLAQSLKSNFVGFLPTVMPVLFGWAAAKNPALVTRRARATEALGLFAIAVGESSHKPYLDDTLRVIMTNFVDPELVDNLEIREFTFGACGSLLKVYGSSLNVEWMETTRGFAIISLRESEEGLEYGQSAKTRSDGISLPSVDLNDISDDEGDDGDDDDDDDDDDDAFASPSAARRQYRTALLDEKCAAVEYLGVLAESAPKFLLPPVLEDVLKVLFDNVDYPHPAVRTRVMEAFARIIEGFLPSLSGVSQQDLFSVVDKLLETFLESVEADTDARTVIQSLVGIASVAKTFGMEAILEERMRSWSSLCLLILLGDASCQAEDILIELDEIEEELRDDDPKLAVIDTWTSVAEKVGGNQMLLSGFELIVEGFGNKITPNSNQECELMGFFAEMCKNMGESVVGLHGVLLEKFLNGITRHDSVTRRNSAFGVAMIFRFGDESISRTIPHVLTSLWNLTSPEEEAPVRDNCASCVAWILQRYFSFLESGSMSSPVVQTWMDLLPLKEDFDESSAVVSTALFLLQHKHEMMLPAFGGRLLDIFATHLGEDHIPDVALVQQMKNAIVQMCSLNQFERWVSGLETSQQDKIRTFLSSQQR